MEGAQNSRARERADELLDQMTLEEQAQVLSGGALWGTAAVPRLGLHPVGMTDGPSGVRGRDWLFSTSANVPCPSALGATWNRSLIGEIGALLGREVRAKGARVHLAPTLNLHRTPVGGRNFESFGEDPHLAAALGVAYVRGVRSQDVASCAKHLVGNDTEFERYSIDSRIDERTLREVYLRPFEEVVTAADVDAVMVAYNRLNGPLASESADLLTGVLRDDWGFEGPVVSDWFCVRSTTEALVAGTDLEMPGPTAHRGQALVDAVRAGEVGAESIRAAARRVLTLLVDCDALEGDAAVDDRPLTDADHDLMRRAAADAMVLVANRPRSDAGPLLPLDLRTVRTVAVIGPNARQGQLNGGGSVIVRPAAPVHPLEAITRRFPDVDIRMAEGCSINRTPPFLDPGLCGRLVLDLFEDPTAVWRDRLPPADRTHDLDTTKLLWFDDPFGRPGPPRFSARLTTEMEADRDGIWTIGLRSVGDAQLRIDGEVILDNRDLPMPEIAAMGKEELTTDLELRKGDRYQIDLRLEQSTGDDGLSALFATAERPLPADAVDEAVAAAAEADLTIVVVGTNPDWETEGRDREDIGLPGDQDELIHRVAEVSSATVVVVNAGSPVAMPWLDEVDSVLVTWFPGQEFGDALVDVLLGDAEPGGRLPVTFPRRLADTPTAEHHPGRDGVAEYAEGRLIGHRWYDTNDIEPLLPFGFGLGYTEFELITAELVDARTVRVTARNTGSREGAVVVQVYAHHAGESAPDEPEQRLVGFAKATLPPGAEAPVDISLDRRTFEAWDPGGHRWRPVSGETQLRIGTSSRAITHTLTAEPNG